MRPVRTTGADCSICAVTDLVNLPLRRKVPPVLLNRPVVSSRSVSNFHLFLRDDSACMAHRSDGCHVNDELRTQSLSR